MRRLFFLAGIAAGVAFIQCAFFLSPWGKRLEMGFLDAWFQIRGPIAPPSQIAVVAMDEESYRTLGFPLNQPWPRAAHAQLLERLNQAGVQKIVFDILFLEPSPDPDADEKLAQALESFPAILGADVVQIEEKTFSRESLLTPLAAFQKSAAGVALVGLPEEDGVIRRFHTQRSVVTEGMPSLAEAAADLPSSASRPTPRDFLNYYGPPRAIPTYSVEQVLKSDLPPETLKNKIVFVGLSLRTELGPAQKDAYLTPFSRQGRTFGVEIHATAAANLLTGKWIRRFPLLLECLCLSALTILLAWLLLYLKPLLGAGLLLLAILSWAVTAFILFWKGTFIPGACLVVFLPLTYFGGTLTSYLSAKRQQLSLERAFQLYLPRSLAREVSRNPAKLKLGGEKVVATALFSDVENFTSLAESMPPERVAQLLNAYFNEVAEVIFERQGTLIKFIGDAVFALWGTPIPVENHARVACETAQTILAALEKFNSLGQFPPLRTRIGIHTGPMVVGNLGSSRRFDFTAVGDTVNLASRLEGLNKSFGTNILISDEVKKQLPASFHTVYFGLIQAAGKKEATKMYAIVPNPLAADALPMWEQALVSFAEPSWKAAALFFKVAAERDPFLHPAAQLYRREIQYYQEHPPSQDWAGAITFSSK